MIDTRALLMIGWWVGGRELPSLLLMVVLLSGRKHGRGGHLCLCFWSELGPSGAVVRPLLSV